MLEIDEKQPNTTDETVKADPAVIIAKTAIRTLFWIVTGLALAMTLFVSLFPYPSMRLYTDLGLKTRALETGEAYLRAEQRGLRAKTTLLNQTDAAKLTKEGRIYNIDYSPSPDTSGVGRFMKKGGTLYKVDSPAADSKYVSALTNSLNIALELMSEETDLPYNKANRALAAFYADKLTAFTEDYSSIAGIETRNSQIDRYQLAQLAPARRPSFYSYRSYLETLNYKAYLVTGEAEKILIGGRVFPIQTITNTIGGITAVTEEGTMDRYINFFNQMTAYLDDQLWTLGGENMYTTQELGTLRYPETDYPFELLVDPELGMTYLYTNLEKAIDKFKAFALDFDTEGEQDRMLKQLYYVRALALFTDRMFNAMTVIYSNRGEYKETISEEIRDVYAEPKRVWEVLRLTGRPDTHGNDMTLTDYYYNELLPAYEKAVTRS